MRGEGRESEGGGEESGGIEGVRERMRDREMDEGRTFLQ